MNKGLVNNRLQTEMHNSLKAGLAENLTVPASSRQNT